MAIKPRPCVRCGVQIPVERIKALPETRVCVRCSEEIGGEFEVYVRHENVGKAGSLKKNYGGVRIVKRRKRIEPKETGEEQ
jgi:Prokaryotic dksA/traR C4-type zinc finger